MIEQGAADRLGGGADVDEERGVVGDQRGGGEADRFLLGARDLPARLVLHVLDAGGEDGAAVGPLQGARVAEVAEVLADGLRGDLEELDELADGDAARLLGALHDAPLTIEDVHEPTFVSRLGTGKTKAM